MFCPGFSCPPPTPRTAGNSSGVAYASRNATTNLAFFHSQFFMFLHAIDTPGFSTLCFLDRIVRTVTPLIFCTTEYEAGFVGFLLHSALSTANRWAVSEQDFTAEARAHCGLVLRPGDAADPRATYAQYQQIFLSWHKSLKKIILACLHSSGAILLYSCFV